MSELATLDLAHEVAAILASEGIAARLIGAAALAAHGYPRFTEDVDFAVAISPNRLWELTLKLPGEPQFEAADADDPLGGVITIIRDDGRVQIVNFDNPPAGGFPALVRDSLKRSTQSAVGAKLVSLEDLILF